MNISHLVTSSARSLEVNESSDVATNQSSTSKETPDPERMSPKSYNRSSVSRPRSNREQHHGASPRKQTLNASIVQSSTCSGTEQPHSSSSSPRKSLTKTSSTRNKKGKEDDPLDSGYHDKQHLKKIDDPMYEKSPIKTLSTVDNQSVGNDSSLNSPLGLSVRTAPSTPVKTPSSHKSRTPHSGRLLSSKKQSPASKKSSPTESACKSKSTWNSSSANQNDPNELGQHMHQRLLVQTQQLPLTNFKEVSTPSSSREQSRSLSVLKHMSKGGSGESRRNLHATASGDSIDLMNSSGSSLKFSSHHSNNSGSGSNTIPDLYRLARKGKWEEFTLLLADAKREDLSFVYKKDGTTALHLAVMTRTGYIDSFSRNCSSHHSSNSDKQDPSKCKKNVAPLEVIEELLKRAPYQCRLRCTLNGYTPLTYACLVCNDEFSTESAAAMVRLFIQYCPESVHSYTEDGLSPVDIHIVSYSHHHKVKEEESGLGNTSTAVLRTLLNHAPELANLRLKRDQTSGMEVVDGPLELLYKCNAQAFSKATLDEVYNSDDEGTIQSDYTLPEKRQRVMDTVKTWWIWTWTVLLLKYGSKVNNKKKGARFSAVHTAANQVGVPAPLLSICLYAFPRQIKKPIEDTTELGNLPLHAVCSWPCHHDNIDSGTGDALVTTRKLMAINRVLEEYPLALKVNNRKGESALELALKSGTTWDGGVRRIVKAYPKALKVQSKATGLYPFMTAAAAAAAASAPTTKNASHLDSSAPSSRQQDLRHVKTIYGLLRSNPKALALACQHSI